VSVSHPGFHAHSGWYFQRSPDGSVTVTDTGHAETSLRVDASTWASIVASVSATGETAETYRGALAFHGDATSEPAP